MGVRRHWQKGVRTRLMRGCRRMANPGGVGLLAQARVPAVDSSRMMGMAHLEVLGSMKVAEMWRWGIHQLDPWENVRFEVA